MSKYEGAAMVICPLEERDFRHVCAVIVSGDGVNACGHTLLHISGSWSWYVHISGFYKASKFIPDNNYMRYLKENGKREIRRGISSCPILKARMTSYMNWYKSLGCGAS